MRYARIKPNDIANGVGISVSLFTQGCPHHCKGCFNVETWSFDGGKEFTEEDKEYLFDCLDKNGIKRNLSILGGEPLCEQNIDGVIELCKEFKAKYPDRQIYVWTGYEIEYLMENHEDKTSELMDNIDWLIDGKFIEEEKDLSLKLRGSRNQRIIGIIRD